MKFVLIVILWVAFKSATAQDSSWIMKTQLKTTISLRSFNNLPPGTFTRPGNYFIADNYRMSFRHSVYFKSLIEADKKHQGYTNDRKAQDIYNINNYLGIKKPGLTPCQTTLNKVTGVVDGIAGILLSNYSQENRIVH